MKSVFCENQVKNIYTTPLDGIPYNRSSGIIYAVDQHGCRYAVGQVDLERFDEQNFQYIFSPEWSVIDALPASIFQGIPGLDMSLRLERYYRVNMTPHFILERTPGEGREDLWELLEAVGLDYYDRFEWLLRTDMRCGTDQLIVERAVEPRCFVIGEGCLLPDDLQPGDRVEMKSMREMADTNRQLRLLLMQVLRSGAQIWDQSEERKLSKEECSILLKLLLVQGELEGRHNREQRAEGIERAKQEGKYTGRKRIAVDWNLLRQVSEEFEQKKVTEEEAMKRTGISSRSTFYRRLKEVREQELPD
ncbi:MAG: recombinase family protein [Lachnospiraceae bacterium]|nr:recombinase family protein [Lachnospiraceae bacterium]